MRKASGFTLRLGILFYDCLRVFFLLALLAGVTGDLSGPGGMFQGTPDGMRFPYMVYAAPNALFPLMSFFLLIRPGESAAFIPLYTTGKAISLAAFAAWVLSAFTRLHGFPPGMFLFFFLGAADIITMAGMFVFRFASYSGAPEPGFCQETGKEGDN
ncbi:MAG: hypothetical protein LBH35_01965 [Treponema sp.]|jgi:hypothetical protein|nr:hypothetical protein [Treponema sp.]